MKLLTNSFRLQNRDPRWYRDKYLAIIFAISVIAATALLGEPHSAASRRAFAFIAISIVCLILTPQRLFILTAGLAIISVRGLVGGLLYSSWKPVALSAGVGAACYFLIRRFPNNSVPYRINDYSYAELFVDSVVLVSMLLLYWKFA